MTELQWSVRLENQPELTGTEIPEGTVRIRCALPRGRIQSVTAKLPWPMADAEKAFFNGYQSWSWCPEYGKQDRQRGIDHIPGFLLKKYGFDRYGDYHFTDYPRKKGCFHGFSYGYFRNNDHFRFFGSLDERPGYTIFSYDASEQTLCIQRDCQGMEHPGGILKAFDLFFAQGNEAMVFDSWFDAMGCVPRSSGKLAGYTSWYNRYENIRQDDVKNDLQGCRQLLKPGDLFQIDDGWEAHVGDWLEPDKEKFPDGMEVLSRQIHECGFQSGLWLAPFVCTENSKIFREHPQWLLRMDGKPWKGGCNWGGFYSLDIDVPQVQEYLERVFHRILREWNFDLVKLDFLYAAAPYGTDHESRAGRMLRAMELLRSWCAEKKILACGVPLMPAFSLVDYCRIGCDVTLDWDDAVYMRLFHRERPSTRHSLDNTLFRRQLGGRAFGNDPDVFFLREENCRLTKAQKASLSEANAKYGQVLLTSDDPGRYQEAQKAQYRSLRGLWEK